MPRNCRSWNTKIRLACIINKTWDRACLVETQIHYYFRTETFLPSFSKCWQLTAHNWALWVITPSWGMPPTQSQSPFCGVNVHPDKSTQGFKLSKLPTESAEIFAGTASDPSCFLHFPKVLVLRRSLINLLYTHLHLIVWFLGNLTCNSCHHVYYRTKMWHNLISVHYENELLQISD